MSARTDITKTPPRLAYSCECGWLDLGHMDPTSHRPNEGAQSLWDQITKESGQQSKVDPAGYKVVYDDGYVSWSPRDVFERCYRLITDTEKALL